MTKPTIAYIDEVEDERANFSSDAFDSDLFAEVHQIHPVPDLHEMIEMLLDLEFDALVSDFNLTDVGGITYTGEDLVSAFLEVKADFPCFIRTSFEEVAVESSHDVNRVYSKNLSADEDHGRSLFERIFRQVTVYRQSVKEWSKELEALLEIAVEDQTAADIERMIELDSKLEASLGNDARIPKAVKEKLLRRNSDLIGETERLILEIKRALGDEV